MPTNKIAAFFRQFDLHGAQVNLTYNNKNTFQTTVGGVLTILSRLGILAFFFVTVNLIVQKDKSITWSYLGKSPTQDVQIYPINFQNFDIAFSFTFQDNQPHNYEKLNYYRYYDIRIQYVQNLYITDSDGTTNKIRSTTDIPLTNCTLDRFAGLSQEVNDYGINQLGWYCPTKIDYSLQGQVQSTNQTRFRLVVNICKNTTANNNYCASYSDIVALASASRVQIATLNSYFNENEFQGQPIKRSLSVESFPVAIGFTQTIQRALRQITVTTKDSWISSQVGNKEYMFYQDIPGNIKVATTATDFIIFTYSCDSQENFVTRKVLSLSDAAASAGGFASIVLLFARLLASIYAKPLFYESLLKKLYQYEVYRSFPDKELELFKSNDDEHKFEQLKLLINGKKNLQVNVLKHFLLNAFCKLSTRCKISQDFKLYQQGISQLQNALDIEKVLRAIQKIKTLERLVLKDYQRRLLKFSTRHMLRTSIKASKEKVNPYELKARTEQSLSQLVRHRNDPISKSLIKELLGFKKQANTLDSAVTMKSVTPNISRLGDDTIQDQTFSQTLSKIMNGTRNRGQSTNAIQTWIQFSDQDHTIQNTFSKRKLLQEKVLKKRVKPKKIKEIKTLNEN